MPAPLDGGGDTAPGAGGRPQTHSHMKRVCSRGVERSLPSTPLTASSVSIPAAGESVNGKGFDVPSAVSVQRVLLWPTLLAIVFVRTLALLHDADAATMLPHRATIAEDEETTGVLRLRVRNAFESLAQGRPRIFLLSANAACDLLFVDSLFIIVHYCLVLGGDDLVFVGWLSLAPACHRRFAHVFAGY